MFGDTYGRITGREGDASSMRNHVKDAADLYHDIEQSRKPRVIGIAFGTYIILEKEGCLYFIDFHAAHERILYDLSLIHISEPTRLLSISYAVFCLKKKKLKNKQTE